MESEGQRDGRESTHGRPCVPNMRKLHLEPIKDWPRVLSYDYATVPRVVLARKEYLINRWLRHSLFFFLSFFFLFAEDKTTRGHLLGRGTRESLGSLHVCARGGYIKRGGWTKGAKGRVQGCV